MRAQRYIDGGQAGAEADCGPVRPGLAGYCLQVAGRAAGPRLLREAVRRLVRHLRKVDLNLEPAAGQRAGPQVCVVRAGRAQRVGVMSKGRLTIKQDTRPGPRPESHTVTAGHDRRRERPSALRLAPHADECPEPARVAGHVGWGARPPSRDADQARRSCGRHSRAGKRYTFWLGSGNGADDIDS
jgi:hypothetical protein